MPDPADRFGINARIACRLNNPGPGLRCGNMISEMLHRWGWRVGFWLLSALPVPAARETLVGTVMCGYQGWFAAAGDGHELGWQHYGFGKPGQSHIDLWPDVTGFGAEELFETPFQFANGAVARVFSSSHPRTVRRHFDWMQEHGIDGIFLQRFGVSVKAAKSRAFVDRVMAEVRVSAEATGRTWAVMYDLSGLQAGEIARVVLPDWQRLHGKLKVTGDRSYQHHAAQPVVAVWGIGFNDSRAYSLRESAAFLQQLQTDGACVMAGVPYGWRLLERDAVKDPVLLEILTKHADIISPWSVGRYANPTDAFSQIRSLHPGDAAWCRERGKSYLPVIFPGFSWSNLMRSRGKEVPLNSIPRLEGKFFWTQAAERIHQGAEMLYVAMFDEMDEGTAIFKCANEVPAGPLPFATYEGLPSDHYLWLTGQVRKVLRKENPWTATPPIHRP